MIGLSNGWVESVRTEPSQENAWRQTPFEFTDPPVHCAIHEVEVVGFDGSPETLLVIDIEPSSRVHATNKDEVFLRVGDENRKLTFRERQELLYDKGSRSRYLSSLTRRSRISMITSSSSTPSGAEHQVSALQPLIVRGLITKDKAITAGAAPDATNPQPWFSEATVRVLRYRGGQFQ